MTAFNPDNLYVKYRYTVEMPDAIKKVSEVKNSLYLKHIHEILEGKRAVLISPVYVDKENGRQYIQPIFDFDGKKASLIQAINEAKKIKERLRFFSSCYEPTANGVHLVFQVAIEETPETLRNELKGLFKSLDVSSSFRDMPIFRSGSFRGTYTMVPKQEINRKYMDEIKGKRPIDLYDQVEWVSLWEKYLFPKKLISAEIFINTIKKIVRG